MVPITSVAPLWKAIMKPTTGFNKNLAILLAGIFSTSCMFGAVTLPAKAQTACPSNMTDDDGTCLPSPSASVIPDDMRARLYFRCERKWPNDGYVSKGHGQCCDHLSGGLQDKYKVCRAKSHGPFSSTNLKKLPWEDAAKILIQAAIMAP